MRAGCCDPNGQRFCGEDARVCSPDDTTCGDTYFGGEGLFDPGQGQLEMQLRRTMIGGIRQFLTLCLSVYLSVRLPVSSSVCLSVCPYLLCHVIFVLLFALV